MSHRAFRPTLGKKTALIFALIIALATVNFWLLMGLLNKYSAVTEVVIVSGRLQVLSKRLVNAANEYLNQEDHDTLSGLVRDFSDELDKWEASWNRIGLVIKVPAGEPMELLKIMREDWHQFQSEYHGMAKEQFSRERLAALRASIDNLQASASALTYSYATHSEQLYTQMRSAIYGIALVDLLLIAGLFYFLKRSVVRPVVMVSEAARRLSAGDYATRVQYAARDEIGELARTVNQAAMQIGQMLENMQSDKQAIIQAEELFRNLVESSIVGVYLIQDGRFYYVNPRMAQILGYSEADLLGLSSVLKVVAESDREQVAENLRRRLSGEINSLSYDFKALRKDGKVIDVEVHGNRTIYDGCPAVIGMLLDVSDRKHIEARLEYQATHDVLTGLPNRNLLADRLGQAISLAGRYEGQVAAVFVDLDNFKHINDTLGNQQGDQILRVMVERLENALRESDTLARVGGDEFGIVLSAIEDDKTLPTVLQRIMAEIQRPFFLEGREFVITGSIGAAVYPKDGEDAESLIKNADAAMHQAKESGNNLFRFYSAEINARVKERITLEGKLRHAVENAELILFYQPQIDLRSGRVTGAEALLRWKHPDLGMVSPARFIPLAEETGLIVPIGEWVMREACRQTAVWQQEGLGDLCVAVNLSARQFHEQDIPAIAREAMRDAGIEAKMLELEITESMVMRNVNDAIAILFELKDAGFNLAMDDFGTGYSSLSYLKRFAIDKLKIDQSFVRDLATDPNDAAIASAIIALSHSLNLQVIAEGVETMEQLAFLRQHNCDAMQGYYFSKPLPAEEFAALLKGGAKLETSGRAKLQGI